MYFVFLILHSMLRWLVLGSLLYAIYTASRGVLMRQIFTTRANSIRQWTTSVAHIQLLVGMAVYLQSPLVRLKVPGDNPVFIEHVFFKYAHLSMMIIAIVLITIGSAKSKRVAGDLQKYRTILIWFLAALVIILIAIPWPFSPLAHRPYFRTF